MESYSVYEDLANRTGGDIYVGVVGPVRTGKSTFIRKFMQTLVLPYAEGSEKAVMTDELPQAGDGKTVMTTEPKFVPAKAVHISLTSGASVAVRLVDCVGYPVEGAGGFEEDGSPRLVKTPWKEEAIPFEEAATLGTKKVIHEHATIGVLVTTDGSVTGLPRESYVPAEERAVHELKSLGKPFIVLVNCQNPEACEELVKSLEKRYEVPMVALNVENMGEVEILEVMKKVLFAFPVLRIDVRMPKWLQSLSEETPAVGNLLSTIRNVAGSIQRMQDCFLLEQLFDEESDYLNPEEIFMDLGQGKVTITVGVKDSLFYQTLSDICGEEIEDDLTLFRYARNLSDTKRSYDRVKDALEEAEKTGYGIVYPGEEEFSLEKPKLVKKSAGYGVQFRAKAPSYHIVKLNVHGLVQPVIGTKQQGEDFMEDTLQSFEEGDGVWETNIFGKSLKELMGEELEGKSGNMPIELRKKMRRTISKIVNDGKGNLLCILF